ncbi:MAG: hypothetical protein JWN96_1613 [Mycobacterium sp.]|nr:hypothetical protein [Mycobacterium sp.]
MAVIDRLQSWARHAGDLPLRHLNPDEHIVINERQHPAVLIPKAIRTGAGFGMMISRPTIGLVIIFAGAVLADTLHNPVRFKRRTILVLVALLTAALFFVGYFAGPAFRGVVGLGLLIWVSADVFTWFYDRLVVTNQRLYRVHGLVTTHRPSVSLLSITVIDLEMGPAARWFGTLHFDTPAQRDGPLERFTYVRDAGHVHVTILQLRAEASATS